MNDKTFNILLIDDHALFRQGMKYLLLDLRPNISFSDLASCEEINGLENKEALDIILLDYYLPGINGLSAIDTVLEKIPGVPIVVLSSEDDPFVIRESISNGASGYIPKSSTQDIMIAALKLVLAGGTYLPTHVLDHEDLSSTLGVTNNVSQNDLVSGRQLEVLLRAVKGKPNKIISEEMGIAEGTVKAHLSTAYKTLGVKNRTEAVFAVARLGLDHPSN